MRSVLGVDVGGTKVAAGPVDCAGKRLAPPLVEPSQVESTEAFLAGLQVTLRRALVEFSDYAPRAIGLACAGTIDSTRGVVVASPNLPLTETPVAERLQEALGVPVVLENDANAAVRAEAAVGAAAGLRHVVMLTLGTGVGGGLFLDGRVYRGAQGGAGELGHMAVQAEGLACRCGTRGCLEMYASGRALVRYASAWAGHPELDREGALAALGAEGKLTGGAVARLALGGHAGAVKAVEELAGWLGIGLTTITNTFDPEMIVVGGGVADLGEVLLGPARQYVRANAMSPGRELVRIVSARLGNQAGLVGAALTAWDVIAGVPGGGPAGEDEPAGRAPSSGG